ncbi:FHA domain-containing protein [bacterium]|nr:FHA domain-containing protein [bacterium]
MIKLKTIQGEGKGSVFNCNGKVVEIGRATSNRIVLNDPMISWRHGAIELNRGRYMYKDLASRNGTTLYRNKKRLVMKGSVRARTIGKNDELLLGATVLKVLEISFPLKTKNAGGKGASR